MLLARSEAAAHHRVVLSDLDPEEVYEVRITCRDAAGTPASVLHELLSTLALRCCGA